MSATPSAADLPRYSIVASIFFVFLRVDDGPAGWESTGTNQRLTDEQVDDYIATVDARVLRVGAGPA